MTLIASKGTQQLNNSQLGLPDICPGQYIFDQYWHRLKFEFLLTSRNICYYKYDKIYTVDSTEING